MQNFEDTRQRCETSGCFHTAYGARKCSKCLDDQPPLTRGKPTIREVRYAQAYGGDDLAVTERRLAEAHLVPDVRQAESGCAVCGSNRADGDTLCAGCRNNCHRD